MSTNTTFGTNNIISPDATNSLAEGQNNQINGGNANHVGGLNNIIEKGDRGNVVGSRNQILSGFSNNLEGSNNISEGNFNHCGGGQNFISGNLNICYGGQNEIKDNENTNYVLSFNSVKGIRNKIGTGTQNIDVKGLGNEVNMSILTTVEGQRNKVNKSSIVHVEGGGNLVETKNDNVSLGFMHVEGKNNKVKIEENREGSHMTGQRGYFLFDENKSFPEDTYNYSNQLAGGGGPLTSSFLGEGISVIDRTIINGIYPIGKRQSYLNTSDGLSYSIMMKGDASLKTGTFVTLSHKDCCKCKKSNERVLVEAKNNDEVIGVITKSSGFIANAGQFPASERVDYDEYHYPVIKFNISTADNLTDNNATKIETIKLDHEDSKEIEIKEWRVKEVGIKEGELLSPAFLTVPITDVDRSIPFTPFDERPNYYEVALLGSVIVNANFRNRDRYHLKCDVKDGIAVPGSKYWIIKFIDKTHLEILLK